MYFAKSIFVGATALAAFALAQGDLKFTSAPSQVETGKQYELEWTGGSGGPATIVLRQGPSNDLDTVVTITDSASGNSYTWDVDPNLITGNDYALQITQGEQTNYWAVSIAGTASESASASTASSTASSSSRSATASSSATITSSMSMTTSASNSSSNSSMTMTSSMTNSTMSRNATTTTGGGSSRTTTGGSSSSTSDANSDSNSDSGNAPSDEGSGASLKSNIALVFGAFAALAYLG